MSWRVSGLAVQKPMSRLEDLRTNAAVQGILPDALVTVVSTQWFGSEALELTYKTGAGKVATELLGAKVKVTLEIEAQMPDGAPDQVVRTVTETGRTLKFTNHGFETN